MNSIRKKLFFQIGTLVVILVTLLIIANSLFMESFYLHDLKNNLLDYYDDINQIKVGEYQSNISLFINMEVTSNVEITVMDGAKNIYYSSRNLQLDNQAPPPFESDSKPKGPDIRKTEVVSDKIRFLWARDIQYNNESLMLSGLLDNGYLLEIRTPVTAIETNVALFNDFLLIVGVIVFIIAMGVAYFISNYFTRPIRDMNEVTKKMAKLNFDSSCEVLNNDEIGQLASNINDLSIELSNAISSLNEKNKQLEIEIQEKMRLDDKRRELLNNVSHELKTPLALLQGYAEGLKLNVIKDKEKRTFYCDVIMDESIKMNQLVDGLLDIDRLQFGDNILQKTPFDINDFVLAAFKKYHAVFNRDDIKSSIKLSESMTVNADYFMMESVLSNYITNAIHYVNEEKQIKVNVLKIDDKVRVNVFNSGDAIKEEELKKLFDTFYKADQARTREKGGHGLGLAIVKAAMEAHDNKYGVENVKGGVCFYFELAIENMDA